MPENTVTTACVIIIGNEILSGRTQDSNLQYIASGLTRMGIRLREARVIPDVEEVIVDSVNECRAAYDYVFTTGGIGPTHDDITAASMAKAFGVAIHRHPEAVRILEQTYKPSEINEARLKMAETPVGAELVVNPISGPPGFRMENVIVMAGVPEIMRGMFDSARQDLVGGPPVLSRAIRTNLLEGQIAERLGGVQERFPDVDIGSYPFYRRGNFGVSVVLRSPDKERLDLATKEAFDMIDSLGGESAEEDVA